MEKISFIRYNIWQKKHFFHLGNKVKASAISCYRFHGKKKLTLAKINKTVVSHIFSTLSSSCMSISRTNKVKRETTRNRHFWLLFTLMTFQWMKSAKVINTCQVFLGKIKVLAIDNIKCKIRIETKLVAEPFTMCLKESCFPDCWNVSSMVHVFKNIGERSTAKNYALLVFFLWLAKSEKLFNNRFVDHLGKCVFFFMFPVWF